ncbi:glutathione S-transferase family protein [Aeromonas finlandensis]|uniref:glutathione S-transferase family protein n=1 Tax=Aeromonas finlandensis TaxID=1543375 RepID=UPI000AE1A591|nr:glutathione S-transferase N-terminal domain-containing protein [Aeromonas finlandensis]
MGTHFKRIQYKRLEVSASELTTTYLLINPFGYVPSLSVDGFILSESMAIAEYLEERFAANPVLGKNLNEKAAIRRVCEYVNATIHSLQNRTTLTFFRPDLDETSKRKLRERWIMTCLDKLSSTICNESGFAIGNSFSLADIFVASIYKKALQHGGVGNEFYNRHLMYIRKDESVSRSEPQR